MKQKLYSYIRISIAVIVGILTISAFVGIFYPVKIFNVQLTALLQRTLVDFSLFAVILAAGLLVLTLLFGRIYCSTLCPLGLFQELLMLIFRRKITPQKGYVYKYFLAAVVFGALIGGTVCLVRLVDPYTLFGSAATGSWLGLAFITALVVLVWFKGRFFCTNICPVGTVLGLISKHALNKIYIESDMCVSCGLCASKCPAGCIDFKNKTVDNETCIKCFKCLSGCRRSGVHYGIKPVPEPAFSPSRRRLLTGGLVLAAWAVAVKGGIELSKNVAVKAKKILLPAGAGSAGEFANRCLNCNLCVQNCPMKIIKKADGEHSTVYLDYMDSYCSFNCHKCSEVCPSGAISRLTLTEKRKTQIGVAHVNEEVCVQCGLCVMECPRQIIKKADGGYPQISSDECIGCGACKQVCPVKAITISAAEKQRIL